jgi:hypothetical protein
LPCHKIDQIVSAAVAVVCALVLPLRAAPGDLAWARTSLSQASSSADTRALWVDANDNTYAVGRFVETVEIQQAVGAARFFRVLVEVP